MANKNTCPVCGEKELVATGQVQHFHAEDGDVITAAYIQYSVCCACGEELVTKKQGKFNEEALTRVDEDIQEFANVVSSKEDYRLDS